MLEIIIISTICFLLIFKEIAWVFLINKQLNNLNKELNLLKDKSFLTNEVVKNTIIENSTVNNKKNSNILDPSLIKGSQMTGIPIEKLAEIIKDENKVASTQIKVTQGVNEVNMKVNDDKIVNKK